MHGKAGPCDDPDCLGQRPVPPHAHNYLGNAPSSLGGQNEEPPGGVRRWESTRIICDPHKTDAPEFWQVEKLYKAHLVGTCKHHRTKLMEQYPNGRNTCTCRHLLRRRYCRRCFERALPRLQIHFRNCVEPAPFGGADENVTRRRDYHLRWRQVRQMLARRHPCNHRCGKKRISNNEQVMDCRACGGMIIQPTPLQMSLEGMTKRRTRGTAPKHEMMMELDERGRAIYPLLERVKRRPNNADDERPCPDEKPDKARSGVEGSPIATYSPGRPCGRPRRLRRTVLRHGDDPQ